MEFFKAMNSLAFIENIITRIWVSGHAGIQYNEIADEAAKIETSVTGYGPEPFIPISQSC